MTEKLKAVFWEIMLDKPFVQLHVSRLFQFAPVGRSVVVNMVDAQELSNGRPAALASLTIGFEYLVPQNRAHLALVSPNALLVSLWIALSSFFPVVFLIGRTALNTGLHVAANPEMPANCAELIKRLSRFAFSAPPEYVGGFGAWYDFGSHAVHPPR